MLLQRTAVTDHLQNHLGEPEHGWHPDGGGGGFEVARFRDAPAPGLVTFTTVGLSDHPLLASNGRTLRHELVFTVRERYAAWAVHAILQQVGGEAIAAGVPYLRGQVLGPRGPIFPGTRLEALYLMPMTLLPPSFDECFLSDGSGVAFCWLVPLHPWEVEWHRTCGWDEFEDALVDAAPDLTNLHRGPFLDDPEPDTPA